MTPEDIEAIANAVTDRVVLHLAKLSEQVDTSLVSRGLTAGTNGKGGGAIGELRRNLRNVAEAVGVDPDQIER